MFGERTCRHVESQVGRLPLFGRYHQAPRRLEDDYEITAHVLGSGASGDVLLGISRLQASRRVAVKTALLADIPEDKREEFKSELQILICLDHPHIVRLLDVYVSEEKLDMVMECMSGGELRRSHTERGRLSEEEVAHITKQMLLALNYLHRNGVVHRDLKLSNFVYNDDRSLLKLIDFGLSSKFYGRRESDRKTRMRTCCGTLGYVAPEVLDGDYTMQCDMWSLGVIVFTLLAGEMPFFDKDEDQIVAKTRNGDYRMKPDVWIGLSMEAVDFTQALLRTDPLARPSAEEALEHPWFKAACVSIEHDVSPSALEALCGFGDKTPFRRCCMRLMAFSLSDEQIRDLRQVFLCMDNKHHGSLELLELEKVLISKLRLEPEQVEEVHFSEFLAANICSFTFEDELLEAAFRRFDREGSGFVRLEDVHALAGARYFDGEEKGELLKWLGASAGRQMTLPQFKAYLKEEPLDTTDGHKGCCCTVQ
eukprot:TRINITY_DN12745_c0_g1_i3.p1 TRINITY_DN12745_c0_g1~~TRINITY_DN12745_c0_g1_i3.p1  ORF type:complete len:480 (+),score=94.57 TRINITY_DN12745_c0_g1_i3:33-1472(+)